jgi:hypothetical protein
VVAYSSEWTQVAGKVSAVGGPGGIGGFIETSSEGQLSIVEAPSAGVGGQWLMDPTDVTIGAGATAGGTFAGGVFTPGNNDTATVSASAIATALVNGTSVTINTSSTNVNGAILGNITSSQPITVVMTGATVPTLTLNALGAIALSGAINTSGTVGVNMVFNAAGTVGIGGNISTNGGSFTTNGASFSLAPAATLATAGGDVVLKSTGTATIGGTLTAGSGTVWSTGTAFTVSVGGSVSSTTAVNLLQTGDVLIQGPVSAGSGAMAISGQSVDQTAAGLLTTGTLAVRATGDDGGGSAVVLNQAANVVGTLGVSATEGSAAVFVQTSGALNLATIPALVGVPTGVPAFGALSGITTNVGAVQITAGGTVSVSNPINAGALDVAIMTTAGDINGVGTNAITARNVTLDAAGGIGIASPVVLTPSGNVLITTGGADAAGDASVDFTGAIATSKITTLTNTNASQTGLTFSFLSNGAFTVDSAFGAAAENVTINAVGSEVVDSGGNTLTGAVLTVTAGTTVGAAGSPLVFSEGTSAAFTSGGNVFVSSGAYTNPLTFTTDATPRTIELSGTAVTIGTNIAAGASNTLVVAGSTSVTVNAGETLSGSTVYVVSGGDIALAGDVSAGSTALFQGNSVVETTGTISAPLVGVETSGALAGVSIDLGGANSIGTFAMSASGASGTMAIRSTTGLSSGNVGAFSPSGVTAFGALTGTNGNGQNVVVSAGGTLALTAGITSTGANVSLTANGFSSNLVESGGTVSAGNITVNVTGGVGTSGVPMEVATLGNLSVTTAGTGAAGDIFVAVQNAFNASNLTVTTAGGQLVSIASTGAFTVDAAVALGTDDVAFSGTTLSVTTGNSVTAGNVTLATTGGVLTLAGDVTAAAGDTVTITAVGGGVNQTAGTISAPGGTITISGAGAVALGGTGVTATTGTVSVTATGGSGAISGGSITAGNLSLNAGTTINLTGDAVGTLAAVSSGTLTFGNSGGLTVGTVGALSNVTSGGHDLSLTDTTGGIVLTKLVTAGAGNATVHAATGITGNGTVSGNIVTLTADAGDIGTSGTHVSTSSTDLVLSGGNMFVNEANAIGTTAASRIAVTTTSGDTFNLTAPSIVVTTAFGKDATSPISLTTTTGSITASGVGAVTGSVVTLVSDAGIGASASAAVPVTVGTSLALTGSGAGIFVSTAGTLDLGTTTVTDTAGQTVSLKGGNFSTSGAFSASGDNLVLTTAASGVLTITHSVTASNVTLAVDDIAWSGSGALLTGASGNIVIGPVSTEGVAISPGVGAAAGTLRVDSGLLVASTAGNVSIASSTGQAITVGATGAVDLSAAAYNLMLTAPGGLVFNNLMTLPTGSTLTVVNAGGISDTTGTSTALAIPGGTLVVVNETGDIAGQPFLRVDIANLGNVSAAGQLGLWNNNDDLSITGNVTANGTGSTIQIIADANITVTSTGSVHAPNEALALQSNSSGALTVSGNVSAAGEISLYSNGNVALDAGNVSTTGTVNLEANSGAVTQLSASGIQAGLVQASTASGISLAGTHNMFGQVSVANFSFGPPTAGAVVIDDTGTVGQALVVNFLDQETTSGAVTLVATGAVTQSSSFFIDAGGTLLVQTRNASGAAITLTDAGNNLSGVATTLQVLDASGNPTVAANVSFSNNLGAMVIQQIQSGGNVTLTSGSTISQVLGDAVGIHGTLLTVTSDGATTLTNANNTFSALNVTDSSNGALAYTTSAASGLTITGLTQAVGGTATIINSSGAVTSTAALDVQNLVVKAAGGIALTSDSNVLQTVTANNTTSGNINIHEGSFLPLTVTSISETGGGSTSLTSADGITINGAVAAGASLTILADTAGASYTSGASANLTSGGNITITADQVALMSGSAIQTSGTVTIEPFTGSEQVSFGGSGAGVLNLSNAALNSIAAPLVTIGSTGQAGDVGAASGNLRLPGNVLVLTLGNVDLSAAVITSATGASLTVRHDGTLALGNASISGGLVETNFAGSGAGGAVMLLGPLTTPDHAIVFNSPVVVAGATSISTLGTTGAGITFGFSGAASLTSASAGNALTLTAGTGNISFASPVGSAGVPLGLLTVVSANVVTLPTVHASGESLASTGNLTVSGAQLLGTGGFVETGAAHVNVGANISTQGNVSVPSAITLNSPVTLTANTVLDTTNAGASTGSAIALNGVVTGGTFNLTLHGGSTGAVTTGAAITTTGMFTSGGAAFTNSATITAAGILITQTGAVNIDGALVGGASNVSITGVGVTSNANGLISGGNVALAAGEGATSVGAAVNASGNFSSTGGAFQNTAGISGVSITLNESGAATLNGTLLANGGSGVVTITAAGVQQSGGIIHAGQLGLTGTGSSAFVLSGANQVGTLGASIPGGSLTFVNAVPMTVGVAGSPGVTGITTAGPVSLTTTGGLTIAQAISAGSGAIGLTATGGDVAANAAVTTSGTFSSSGTAFTNSATITAGGITLTHSGLVTVDGALAGGSSAVAISGNGIVSNANGTISGGTITLAAGTGDATLGGAVNGSGLFSSTGVNFTNNAGITSAGANLTQSGAVNIDGALVEGTSGVSISGVGITSNANGGISGGAITLAGGSGAVTLGGAVNGSGAFGSSGVAFTNSGTISAVGVSLTHTGVVTIENTIAGNGGAVSITGALSIADASSGISGTGVTLHASGLVDVGGTLGAGAGAAALTSDNSGVTVGGALTAGSATLTGATTVTVGAVTTSGGAVVLNGPSGVTLNGDVNAGTFGVSVNGPTTLGGNDTVSGGAVTFSGAVSGGGKSLTVDSPGVTTFGGSVGSSGSPLAALTTDAAGSTVLNGSVFTSAALAINDALTLGANSTISGGTVNFGSTISGGGVFSLTVDSTTSSAFAGTVGAGTGSALTTFEVDGGTATFTAPTITTSGGQTYSAGVVTSGTATLTGTTFSMSGPMTFGGPTTVSGTTFSMSGPVVFGGTTVLTGTSFSFTNTLNSGSSAADLTVAAAGPVAFGGVVGGGSPLKSLTVTGSTETTLNHAITTTGNISISGPIAISTTLTSSGGGVSLPGVVTLSGTTAVTASGSSGIVFGTGGAITGPQSLTLTSNAAGAKTLVGALGTGTSQRVGNVTFDSAGVVVLGGNIFAANVKFAYKDGGTAPTPSPVFATVYYAKGDLTINTSGTFDMEQNQTLTVFAAPVSAAATFGTATGTGNLTITSNNHAITLGDVASQGVLTVNAGVNQTISIHSRPTEQVLQADGTTLESTATGIVSGVTSPNALLFTGSIAVLPFHGATTQVDFSAGAASVDIADKTNLRLTDATKILDFNRTATLSGAQFFRAGVNGGVLQMVATGVGLPPQNQVNVVPRDVQTLEPERAAAISGALKDTLFQLGIAARDARTDELIEYLVGAALYDDVPYTLDTNADTKIASTRLPYGPVVPTVNRYLALFFKPELDGNGKPVLDEKGKPKMVVQTTIITNTFGQMWGAYHTEFKGGAAAGFRGYLESHQKDNPKAAAALSYLNQVRDLLYQIKDLGLTSTEYERSEKILLGKVRPVTIKADDFLAAILGPSTLTKNMTAMK